MKDTIEFIFREFPVVFYFFTFLYGIVVGSFLNVCIFRIPEKQSVVSVPSHCMSCGKNLHWYELIPLFSWIVLRGKCSGCKAKISVQYPLVEALNGIAWCVIFAVKGLTLDMIFCCALFSSLLVISVIDARTMEIPNGMVLVVLVLGILRASWNIFKFRSAWIDTLLGPVIMGGILFAILILSGGRAMGGGDVKLMFAAGIFLGLKLTFLSLFIACIVGSIIHITLMKLKKKGRELAFGPYLSIGFMVSVLWGGGFLEWYISKYINF